jgi:4-amino-4-deoxy-L-arabinose transferase-like glycosyltransferase
MKTGRKRRAAHRNRSKEGDSRLKSRGFRLVVAVFLLALLVRGSYLYDSSDNPTFSAPVVDAMTYDQMAHGLVEGEGLTSEFFWQPTFYPLFLSAVYRLSSSSILCVKVLQMLLGGLTCALVYRLAEKTFSRNAAILAGVITAVYMPLVFFEAELLGTGWATFWAVAVVLALLKAKEKPAVGSGFILGGRARSDIKLSGNRQSNYSALFRRDKFLHRQ